MQAIKTFEELTDKLLSTQSRLEKEAFLKQYEDEQSLKDILHFVFNRYIVSGISTKKVAKFLNEPIESDCTNSVLELLKFVKKNNTGKDSDIKYVVKSARQISAGDDKLFSLILSIVRQDLRLGLQAKTLNKVYGEGFIPAFDVMLAEKYSENIEHVKGKEFILTEKIDGVRCVLIFDDGGEPRLYSRQGQPIEDLVQLESDARSLDKSYVYDGEMILKTGSHIASKDLYRMTVKITSSDNIKKNVVFHVFDALLKEHFVQGISKTPAVKRKAWLNNHLMSKNLSWIVPLPILYQGRDESKITYFLDKMVEQEKEGVMVNMADGAYECKRTKNLLKVKKFLTADVLVKEVEEGTGRNKNRLGAAIVEFIGPDGKTYACKVGSGFCDEDRYEFWQDKTKIVGKIIEIGYFEISTNQVDNGYSLRFPTFRGIRNDKTEISMY